MNSCVVKLSIFLFLTEGTLGAERTINVRKSASVEFVCSNHEVLRKCYCPSFPEDCQHCTHWTDLVSFSTTYSDNFEKYFKLSGLKHSNSGLYACNYNQRIGQKYRVNVLEDQYSTVVIVTVGQSVLLSSGTQQDIMEALEKHWCRLDNADVCQPNTIMGPENGPRGDFQIPDPDSSFFLEKRNVTHNDTGSYRLTLIFPNQTKVYVVKLQVKDKGINLQIIPVRDKPKPGERFEIICQYSQELENVSKYWLCDNSECPDTVTSVDDRFKSALVLTLDHAPCSKIEQFMCVAKTSEINVKSNVYLKHYSPKPVKIDIADLRHRRVQVNIYSLLQLSCYRYNRNIWDYRDFRSPRYDDYIFTASWCKVSGNQCTRVIEKTQQQSDAVILEMCVTPNNHETTYRCKFNTGTLDVTLAVVVPPPDPPYYPPWRPEVTNRDPSGPGHNIGILIIVISIILIIGIMLVASTKCNGQKLKRLFERRTPLAAVDIHANMYANAIAQYYNQRYDVPPPDKQGKGDDKEISTSSDDAFEELPVRPKRSSMKKEAGPKRSSMKKETDYVRVKPGGGTWSLDANALGKKGDDKEISSSSDDAFEELPVRPKRSSMKKEAGPKRSSRKKETDYVRVKPGGGTWSLDANAFLKDSNMYGSGRKGEVGYTSKTKTGKKQGEVGAQSSSGRRDNNEDDDDYEVNYTRVTIKPKH